MLKGACAHENRSRSRRLPSSSKELFRPTTMNCPDQVISERRVRNQLVRIEDEDDDENEDDSVAAMARCKVILSRA
jgi:hypothetical protein